MHLIKVELRYIMCSIQNFFSYKQHTMMLFSLNSRKNEKGLER